MLGDTIVVFSALILSSWIRFGSLLSHVGIDAETVHWTDYLGRAAFGTFLFIVLLPHRKMYDLPRVLSFRKISSVIVKTSLTWLVAFMALSWLLRSEQEISRVYVFVAFIVTVTSLIGWRMAFTRLIGSEAVTQHIRRKILFVGWSPQADSLTHAVSHDPQRLYDIVGYVGPQESAFDQGWPGARRIGSEEELPTLLRERSIDTVVLADMDPPNEETVRLANLCEKEMVDFKVIPSCFEILLSGLHLQSFSGVPVLGISQLPLDFPTNLLLKQLFDYIGGAVGFLLSAPIVAFFGLLVYLESPGPIIYKQRRTGRDGRDFWIYKIRSMKLDAERDGKVGWSVKNDDRRLRIGGFMRKWNIDELPQFWNVLRGEMSLVGPRPERPELIERFKEEIPHYNARHGIKPGLTGWAQVNGFRGDTDLGERVRCDLFYIENWNLLLDLQIMVMTFFVRTNAC